MLSRQRMRVALIGLLSAIVVVGCGESKADVATGQATPASATPPGALAVGAAVPRYDGSTLDGKAITLAGSADSLTLVNVWATWCASCREEMQDLEQMHRSYRPRGIRVIAVSIDAGSEALVRRFVKREQLSFAVVHDQQGALQSLYHVVGVPSTYLIGHDGKLLWQHTGGLHGSVATARAAIETVLTTPSPTH